MPSAPLPGGCVRVDVCDPKERLGEMVCTIGVFDGLHIGHRYLIEQTRADAAKRGVPCGIVTFDIDPAELFSSQGRIEKILSNDDRLDMLSKSGADYLFVLPFNRRFASTGALEFIRWHILAAFRPLAVHVGSDFRFGAGASATVDDLAAAGSKLGFACYAHDLKCSQGIPVHSTRIRQLLAAGDVKSAASLLSRPHFVRGRIVHGRGQGAKAFGIPTANVELDVPYALPRDAVYAGYVCFDRLCRPAAINVGRPATFSDANCVLEPHIVDFDGDIYGRDVAVIFTDFLRDQMVFSGPDELERVVSGNIEWVRKNLKSMRWAG